VQSQEDEDTTIATIKTQTSVVMADSITARSGRDKRVEVVKKLTDPNRKLNCQKCQKGASKSALLSWRNEHTTIAVEIRLSQQFTDLTHFFAYPNFFFSQSRSSISSWPYSVSSLR